MGKRSAQQIDAIVGSNIKIARLERGLSQTELGRRIGVSFQQIQKYESGTNRVGASRLTKIAEALDVAILTLFGSGKGMAERQPDHVPAARLLANPDALRVLQAFDKIDVSGVRLAALHLFEAVGEMPSKRTPRPPPARRRR